MAFKIASLEYPLFFSHPLHAVDKDNQNLEPLDLAARRERVRELRSHSEKPQGITEDRKIFYERIVNSLLGIVFSKKSKNVDLLKELFDEAPALRRSVEEIQIVPSDTYQVKEVILKIWFAYNGALMARVLFLRIDPKQPIKTVSAYFFGNVDLFVAPPDQNVDMLEWKEEEQSGDLPTEIFSRIARYLDNGQSLNLSRLHEIGVTSLGEVSSDPYQQCFHDFTHYSSIAPNGCLLLTSLNDPFRVTHQTPYKDKILESKMLNISKSGCMGNVVYTTELVGDQGDLLGGHAIGLHRRKYGDSPPTKEQLICMEVQRTGNFMTNWIEKLGRGELFLLARERWLFSDSLYAKSILSLDRNISQKVLDQYHTIYPLLVFCKLHAKVLKKEVLEGEGWKIFQVARTVLSHIGSSQFSIANGIFFEIVKDYTLLFQSDSMSTAFRAMNSFNMTTHYEMVFEIHEEMRLNWDTGCFPISFEKILEILRRKQFLNIKEDELLFARFFLDRLAYYINVGCLRGQSAFPHPDAILSFLDLSLALPNLTGLIYNNLMKRIAASTMEVFKNSSMGEGQPVSSCHLLDSSLDLARKLRDCANGPFKEYSQQLQAACDQAYEDRHIDVTVKCGFSRTEEIGIRPSASVRFPDFELLEIGEQSYELKTSSSNLDLSIQGTSNVDGFTKRY